MTLRDLDIDIDLKVDIDGLTQVNAQVDAFVAKLSGIDDIINIKIDLDIGDAIADIMRLDAAIKSVDNHVDIDFDANTAGAMAQIAALQAQILALQALLNGGGGGPPLPPIPPIPNLGGGIGGIGGLLISLPMLAIKGFVLITALQTLASVALVAVGAIGTLGVALGVAASGVAAFVGAIGVMTVGIGGVAALAIPSIMRLYDENAKLTEQQKEMKTHIDSLKNAWTRMSASMDDVAFPVIEAGVNTLKTAMTMVEPVIRATGNTFDILFHNLNTALQGERMTAFWDYLERSVPRITEFMGNGLGNIGQAIANLFVAFEPLTDWMAQGFQDMMGDFANWTFDLQGSEKLTAFIDYIKTELPQIGSIIGNATTGITNFFAAFDVTASDGLQWLSDKMKEFSEWSADLDNNQGFQDMLADIEELAPKVGEAISLIADSVGDLVTNLANSGGMDTFLSFLEGVERTASGESVIGKILFGNNKVVQRPKAENAFIWARRGIIDFLFGDNGASTLEDRGITIKTNADTTGLQADITNATQGPYDTTAAISDVKPPMMIDPLDVRAEAREVTMPTTVEPVKVPASVDRIETPLNMPIMQMKGHVNEVEPPTSGLPPMAIKGQMENVEPPSTLPTMTLKGRVDTVEPPPVTNPVNLPARVSSVDTTGLAPVRMPLSLSGVNPLNNFKWPALPTFKFPSLPTFTWPSLPKFSWPSLPKWSWPAMPRFSWPAYPKFSWPPIPKVTVNVKTSGVDGSHSSGLGRVPFDGYIGELHKGEAVIQANEAQALRDAGILQGDGQHPKINANPTTQTTNSVTTVSNSNAPVVHVHAPITIGGTNVSAEEIQKMIEGTFNRVAQNLFITNPVT